MARINLEDKFWKDVGEVAARIGDYYRAVGQAIKCISFGQERYAEGRPISFEEFKSKLPDAEKLMPEFARRDGDTVIIAGAEKHFEWLKQKREAGRSGGLAKASKRKQTLPSYSSSPSVSLVKNLNSSLGDDAKRCLDAVQRFSPDRWEELRDYVGDELFQRVKDTGGWQSIREMKRDQWAITNLSKRLTVVRGQGVS